MVDDECADQLAALLVVLERGDAESAAALRRVFFHLRALGVAAGGGDHEVGVLTDDGQRQQRVLAAETHALDASGGATHRAQRVVVGSKAHSLAFFGNQQEVVVGGAELCADQRVALVEVDGDQSAGPGRVIIGELRLLHAALFGGEYQVGRVFVGL